MSDRLECVSISSFSLLNMLNGLLCATEMASPAETQTLCDLAPQPGLCCVAVSLQIRSISKYFRVTAISLPLLQKV